MSLKPDSISRRRPLALLLVLLLLVAACGTADPTPTPPPATAAPTTMPDPTATTNPSPTPEPSPTAEPTATAEPSPTPEPATAVFSEDDCEFNVPSGRDVTCGWLTVPEDRSNLDDDTTIDLHVAIFASDSDDPAPDPIVYLEGGPGGDALEAIPLTFERNFAPYLANHDFIMFDQRGTGYAQPSLACPELRDLSFEMLALDEYVPPAEAYALSFDALLACQERLQEDGVNLAAYNSAASAADLNDLRRALGYEEWNLLGISYGTRLAQTTMRDYPAGLRSVILDSTYPLQNNLLTDTPDNVARAFDVFFAGCAADSACSQAYPDLETVFFDLVARHNEAFLEITITDLLTGDPYDTAVSGDDLVAFLFQSLYSTEIIPELPQLIYEIADGETTNLAALFSSFLLNGEFASIGMQFSVQCHEENLFTDDAAVTTAAVKYPELANFFTYSINLGPPALEVCAVWGAGMADALENEPVNSDIPTLVLAGEYDPITPPAWGEQVAGDLTNATFYEFPGTGHGVSISGECAVSLVESFLADPTAEPEAVCLADLGAPDFVVPGTGETAVTMIPFTSEDFSISGVVPEGWEEAAPGAYARGNSALGQTVLLQQAADLDAATLLGILTSQFGLEEAPASSGTYEATTSGYTWTLYESEVQGFPATFGLAETEDGMTLIVVLISAADEHEALRTAVFQPALEALTVIEE